MNETEIKWRKQLLKSLANITDHISSEYEIISNGVKTISFLEQENKQLKDNWNILKEFIDTLWLDNKGIVTNIKDKIELIEQGSDE